MESATGHVPTSADAAPATNALGRAIGVFGDEWTLLLLRAALSGATKYSDFRRELPISDAVLAVRLDSMVSDGLLERHVYSERPPRAEYRLTAQGRSTWPLLVAIWNWERHWVTTHVYATPPMRHTVCGHETSALYCCASCGVVATAASIDADWGPLGGWDRSVPAATTRRRSGAGRRGAGTSFYPDTMEVFGNRWSAAIVGAAFRGITRFRDFAAALNPPPSLLAERLGSLCARGILERAEVPGRADWSEYRLTRKGMDLFPIVDIVIAWGERWFGDPLGPVLERTHHPCGSPFRGQLVCDHCGEVLRGATIELSPLA